KLDRSHTTGGLALNEVACHWNNPPCAYMYLCTLYEGGWPSQVEFSNQIAGRTRRFTCLAIAGRVTAPECKPTKFNQLTSRKSENERRQSEAPLWHPAIPSCIRLRSICWKPATIREPCRNPWIRKTSALP